MKICEFSVKRKVTTLMFFMAVLLIACVAFFQIPLEFLPEMNNSWLSLYIPFSGSSPSEVEQQIARPVEELLSTIPGIKRMDSFSSSDSCYINLNLKYGLDLDFKSQEILNKIDSFADKLPEGTGRIHVFKMSNNSMPVQFIAIALGESRASISGIVEKRLKPELMRIPGIAKVDIQGLRKKEILIQMSLEKLNKYNISPFQVYSALSANLKNHDLGSLYQDSIRAVRLDSKVANPLELADILLRPGLKIKHIADVTWDYPEIDSDLRIDGAPAFIITLYKESSANVVKVCGLSRTKLEELKKEKAFEGMQSKSFFDQGLEIEKTLSGLKTAGLYGAFLAVIILFIFLGKVSATLIVGLSIPFSLLMTVVLFYFSAISFNIISLSGLIIGIGMLVDNAIVVIESVTRKFEQGLHPVKAAYTGASEVGTAVFCSTLTSIVVFLPLVFTVQNEASVYIREFGLAISYSLLSSLFVSLTLIPLLGALFIRPDSFGAVIKKPFITRAYSFLLSHILINPFTWFILVFLLMLYTFTAVPGLIQKSGILQIGQRRYRMKVKTPEFWDYKKTDAFFKKLEKLFINNKNRLNLLAVSTSFSVSGGRFSFFMNEEEHKGLGLKESRTALKDILPIDWPGVRFRVFGEGNIGNTGDMQGISVNLSADDSALIEPYINEFADQLRLINEITSVNTEFEKGQKELIFEPDLEACENYGVSPSDIARYISFSSRGTKAGWFDTPKGEYEVTLRMHKRDVKSLGQIKNFLIPSTSVSDGIPLERLVKSRYRHGPESITRKQGRAVISVNIECASEKLDIVKKKIKEISRAVNLPPGCEIQFDPAFDKSDEALRVIFSTLGIAFILIYFIMASLFESLFQPFVIIFTFPFGAFGVIWTLFLTDTPFDIMSGCGALILAGIVVNNAIVLIDSINSHRKTGLERFAAVKEAALLRLRPVLMTGLTTVFGLIPMLIGGATQASKIYSGLARAVMGGLSAAIIFTLLFIPVIYIVIENIVNFFRKAFSFLFCEKP